MLKRASVENREDEWEDYHSVRDRAVVTIRKRKRDDIFNQHRMMQKTSYQEEQGQEDQEEEFEEPPAEQTIIIVDPDLALQIREISKKAFSEEDLSSLADSIQSQDLGTVLEGVIGIRRILMVKNPPTMALIELGAHRRLIELTSHASAQLRLEAWWALANLATGDSGECGFLVQKGVIPSFLRCLEEDNALVAEQGVWGLANICVDSTSFRDCILEQGGLTQLIAAVNRFEDTRLTKAASWAVANLCRGKPPAQYELVEQGVLLLCYLLESECITEDELLIDILIAINIHCSCEDRTDREMQSLLETEFVLSVLALTTHYNSRLVKNSLKILNTLLIGKAEVISFLLKLKILDYLERCLGHKRAEVRQYACIALSSIAASHQKHVTFLFARKSLLKTLLELLVVDVDFVQIQVLIIFVNLGENCGEDLAIEEFYLEAEVVVMLVELLKVEDEGVVLLALQNLFNVLQRADEREKGDLILNELDRCNGFALLHHLQFSQNRHIAYETHKIICRFIGEVEINSLTV